MSLTSDGQFIRCDGDGCLASAAVPVGLRQTLRSGNAAAPAVSGWLYVSRGGVVKHFCSNCKSKYLGALGPSPADRPIASNP